MALADVSSAARLVAQTIGTIQTLLSNWDIASQEWESMSSQLRDLRKKSEMWEEQLKKSGMMSDRRLFEMFNNANNLLQAEETKLKEKGQPRAARCCFLLKASMLPVSLGQTLKNVSDEYGKIQQLLEDEQLASALLEGKAMRTPVTPAVPKDARYVRLATTEDSILKSLQDPNGSSITLLHGPSGAGKSTLARAVTRHYVDRIGCAPSDDTSLRFDYVAFLEFGPDVQPGVQKQRLELIGSLGGKVPSGGEEQSSPDIDHLLRTLLKDSAVLVILDDVWDAEPLQAFMKFGGEKVRYLVTTQIVDLWGCNTTNVRMENMSLADARKLLAARIGFEGQEIPQHSLEVADKIIREVQHNPLALASVACALRRGGGAPSRGVWDEVSKALSSVLQEPPKHQKMEIFGHLYPSSLWRSISLGLESLPKKTIDLLVFISMFEKTSIPDVVLRIVYSWYCERLSTDPMFEKGGNELEEHGAIIQIPIRSEYSGIEIRSWTLHSLYGMFIQKDMEREREHACRSLTETWKTDVLLEIMEISKEDDMDPEKIIILLCVLYMENTLAQKVIEKSHKLWELIETWKLRRSAAEKILLLLQDTDEEKKEAKNGISHVHKVYFSYVCSGELHTASFLFLLTNCGPEAAMLACDTLDDILTSDRTLKWSEEMWEMVVAVSSLLGQRGDKVRHVLPASVLIGMSYRFSLSNFAGSDSSEQVIGNLFRAVEGDDFEEEVQEVSMIALANLISQSIPMPAHIARIVTLVLSHKNLGVKVHAARALSNQTTFEEGRKLVANAMGDEGVTRLTETLQERASPEFIRWGLEVLTVVDPTKGDTVHLHLKEAYLGRGTAKRILGFLHEALAQLHQAHLLDPNDAGILCNRGIVKQRLKRLDDALEDLNQAHLLDPNEAGILRSRGIVKRELKRLDDALEDLNQAHLLDPNEAGILRSRGIVKRELKRLDDALEDLNQAHLLDPNDAAILCNRGIVKMDLKRLDDALEDLNQAHLLDPNDAAILCNRGIVKRDLKRLDDALEDLNQAHLLDPNDAAILCNRGIVKMDLKRLDDALEDLNQAHLLDPNDAEILCNRGIVKMDLKRLDDALEDLNQAHLLDPNEAGILRSRGIVKRELKRLDDALEDLNQAHLLDPKDAGILQSRGMVKRELKRLDDALEDLNQAHLLDPNDAAILCHRGIVKMDLKRLDDALEDLNQAHLLDPNEAGILRSRGIVKRELKRLDDALEDLNQAHLLDPNHAGILHSRGKVKNLMGRFSDALADFDSAYVLDPSLQSFWLDGRAHAKARLQDFGGALEDLNKAVELEPNNDFYLQERGVLKRMMGDLEGALADLGKGLELKPNDYERLKHRGYVKFLMGDEEGARADAEWAITIKPARIDIPSYNHFKCLGVMDVKYLNYELE